LHAYLLSVVKRTQPLFDVEAQQREAIAEFNSKWEGDEIEGWEEKSVVKIQANGDITGGIWCSACEWSLIIFSISITMESQRSKELLKADSL
jgi:splicing factor 3A subunit 3